MSMTRINREETIGLSPYSTRAHYGHIQDTLIEVCDEVTVDVALRLESAGVRWATARVKVVVDLETKP